MFGFLNREISLKRQVQRSKRWQRLQALALVAPLLIFVLASFLAPIFDMLFRSVENQIVVDTIPRTIKVLSQEEISEDWIPSEEMFWALYADLSIAVNGKTHTRLGSRLNYERPGTASVFRKTGRNLKEFGASEYREVLTEFDPEWQRLGYWDSLFGDPLATNLLPETAIALDDWKNALARIGNDPYEEGVDDFLFLLLIRESMSLGAEGLDELRGPHAAGLLELLANMQLLERIDIVGKFEEISDAWTRHETWQSIKLYSTRFTEGYFLNAVDLKKGVDGPIVRPANERLYMIIFVRTMVMSVAITLAAFALGYPVAYFLAHLPLKYVNIFLILVLLPFWTSLLVRTSAWKVLLQQEGVINDILVSIGIIADSNRLTMINNQTGTIVAMTHILLPFMILPLYSVMKTIPPFYVRAAKSLGANDWTAFRRVYFPQSLPGIGAGSVLVFILAIGYYITPELVGGTKGTFISNRIAYHISSSLNWGLGAALGTILLVVVLILYWVYDRIVGIDNVKLG